jgi:hypothetical protein
LYWILGARVVLAVRSLVNKKREDFGSSLLSC